MLALGNINNDSEEIFFRFDGMVKAREKEAESFCHFNVLPTSQLINPLADTLFHNSNYVLWKYFLTPFCGQSPGLSSS